MKGEKFRAWPWVLSFESCVGELAGEGFWLHPDIRYAISVQLELHPLPVPVGFTMAHDVAQEFHTALTEQLADIERMKKE